MHAIGDSPALAPTGTPSLSTVPSGDLDEVTTTAGAPIGRFTLVGALGAGGMGVVLEAHDPDLDRRVAIKLLRNARAVDPEGTGRARLQREAQAMARVAHPNVVAVYEVGSFDAQTFIAMELVPGTTLRAWLRTPRPWREIVAMFVAAGRGLAAAHAAGLVHRDFKPENVLVGHDRRPRVSDFGLVSDARLGDDGACAGTPAYMSPEHWHGTGVDARSDQFSFCVALWEALWLRRPFGHEDPRAAVLAGTIAPPLALRGVPAPILAALTRGLARDPAARWPSMPALLDELERRAAPRRWPMFALATVVAAGAGAGLYATTAGGAAPDVCARAADGLAATWRPEVRAHLRASLAAVNPRYAVGVADRVAAHLDGYATAWSQMAIGSCEATHVRQQQSPELLDRRTACLEARRGELGALVAQLATNPDGTTLDAALRASYALAPITGCAEAAVLGDGREAPAPAARAQVAALASEVATIRALYLTGHYREGWLRRWRSCPRSARSTTARCWGARSTRAR